MIDLHPHETYYLAGLIEGEGYVRVRPSGGISLSIEMIDHDVIAYVAALIHGKVLGPYDRHARQQTYVVAIHGEPAAQLMQRLRPLLFARRQKQVDKVLSAYYRRTKFDPVPV
jgi:hypothetical protein